MKEVGHARTAGVALCRAVGRGTIPPPCRPDCKRGRQCQGRGCIRYLCPARRPGEKEPGQGGGGRFLEHLLRPLHPRRIAASGSDAKEVRQGWPGSADRAGWFARRKNRTT